MALPDGIQCVWGDFSTATDHVQIFGWAPITQAQAETAASELVAEGWTREESDEGVYVTENPETAIAVDEDGLRPHLPLRRRLGEVRRHQAGHRARGVAAELIARDA